VLLDLKIGGRKKITYICRRVVSLEGSGAQEAQEAQEAGLVLLP